MNAPVQHAADGPRVLAVILEGRPSPEVIQALRQAMATPEQTVVHAPPSIAAVIEKVAFETGVPRAAIVGPGRCKPEVRARRAISWVVRQFGHKTLQQTGNALGGRDHATVSHQVARAEDLRERDPAFRVLTDKVVAHFDKGEIA